MDVSFVIELLLAGISASTILVVFLDPPARRIVMALALGCAACLILVALLGLLRTAGLAVVIYAIYERSSRRRAEKRAAEDDTEVGREAS